MSFHETVIPEPTGEVLYRPTAQVEAGTSYARAASLGDDVVLATCEAFGLWGFPVFESRDGGRTWESEPLSIVREPLLVAEGWTLLWQPTIFADGARVLLSGASILRDADDAVLGSRILLFESTDGGSTWVYLSEIVSGSLDEGNVWEPELQRVDGMLVAFYSTEAHKPHIHQAIAHRVSSDEGITWGEEVLDVYKADGFSRPGMAIVREVPDGFRMAYEVCDARGGHCRLYVSASADGFEWPSDPVADQVAESADRYLHSTPAMTVQGDDLVVSGMGAEGYDGRVVLSRPIGGERWRSSAAPVQWQGGNDHAGYSQALLATDRGILHLSSSARDDVVNEMRFAVGEVAGA